MGGSKEAMMWFLDINKKNADVYRLWRRKKSHMVIGFNTCNTQDQIIKDYNFIMTNETLMYNRKTGNSYFRLKVVVIF